MTTSATDGSAIAWLEGMDDLGAYIDPGMHVKGTPGGPLTGLTVTIKDMYDIAGQKTGFGHPLWLETHPVAEATCPAVQALLDAGAELRGRAHMDELAYALNGENAHYGTPTNPAAPGHIPGGSSSGAAVAVAAGHVDVGLGSDTGGSVRVPASYCGILGVRPTHGRISLEGARPLAPSFDTVGWFARNMRVLKVAGSVLLGPRPADQPPLKRLLWPTDAWALALPEAATALKASLGVQSDAEPAAILDQVAGLLGENTLPGEEVALAVGAPELVAHDLGALSSWMNVFRYCQGAEIWQVDGEWVKAHNPTFGPGIKERFEFVASITQEEWDAYKVKRAAITARVRSLLGSDGILILPTAPGAAPPIGQPNEAVDDWRRRLLSLTCIAGLSGLPQVNLPIAKVGGLPVGLSVVGPAGADEVLLEAAEALLYKVAPALV